MSKIEWTEKTWNPVVGCSVVSPGCTNCYAMKMAARLEAMAGEGLDDNGYGVRGTGPLDHYRGTTKRSKAGPVWTGKLALAPEHIITEPLRRRKPTMYFVNSMSDLFHESVPDKWIDRVFAVMALCPQHTFQVLTKRSTRMREYMRRHDIIGLRWAFQWLLIAGEPMPHPDEAVEWSRSGLPNVWLGVSCERQQEADARIPDLLATPAAVRFVSAEPLLGPVDFTRLFMTNGTGGAGRYDALRGIWRPGDLDELRTSGQPRLDWIIVGGESGANARPMHPDWARSIRDQCVSAGVPFFFKQWGEWAPTFRGGLDQTRLDWRIEHGQRYHRLGKKRAGRLLDGLTWDQMPALDDAAPSAAATPETV